MLDPTKGFKILSGIITIVTIMIPPATPTTLLLFSL